jgi:hypothetical protein
MHILDLISQPLSPNLLRFDYGLCYRITTNVIVPYIETFNFPVLAYTCVGFCNINDAIPSPKVYTHRFGMFVLETVNCSATHFFTIDGDISKEVLVILLSTSSYSN